uniref:F-box domain-containing protein n=1 Tax=Davidia involucrata TaxID=16924 RepID=A0A5B7A9R3_DAVIN
MHNYQHIHLSFLQNPNPKASIIEMSDHLPADAVGNILSRLPVKSLVRFRCVSKPWCALIDSPDFIKTHLNRSVQNSSNLSLIVKGKGLYSVDFDTLHRTVELDYTFMNSDAPDVLGSCNGLLLVGQGHVFYLWNPSTRKYRQLPILPIQSPNKSVGFICKTYGFGYDSINDDYKVVRIVEFTGKQHDWFISEVQSYSLKSNSWRRIQDFPYSLPFKLVWGVKDRDILYSVVRRKLVPNSPRFIVAFDIGAEEYRLVPQPDYSFKDFEISVGVLGGCLCINGFCRDHFDVWIMKDYGVKESWIKLLSVAPPIVRNVNGVCPLAYSKSGGEILIHGDARLFWYEHTRKTVREARVRGLPNPFYSEVCVGSLVPLNGYGGSKGIKEEDVQEKGKGKKSSKKRDDFLSVGFKLKL